MSGRLQRTNRRTNSRTGYRSRRWDTRRGRSILRSRNSGRAPSPNTVQLREDGDEGWTVGLGPECVADAFDVPADVFAFDDPWVGAEPSGRVEPVGEPADCLGPAAFSVLRGESRPVGRWWHERC